MYLSNTEYTSTLNYIPHYNHLKILIFFKIKLNQMKELYVEIKFELMAARTEIVKNNLQKTIIAK